MNWLALFVIVSIVGQLALIWWLRSRNAPDLTRVKIARLLEDAADHQLQHSAGQSAKLKAQTKGVGGDE